MTSENNRLDGRDTRWTTHRVQRRRQLVEAAIKAIRKHGATVGMDDIAATAGTPRHSLVLEHAMRPLFAYLRAVGNDARGQIRKIVGDQLTDWLDRNPQQAKRIITKAIDAATARLAARKARETARRKSVFESASMPDKLKDCTSKDPSISEIFLEIGRAHV